MQKVLFGNVIINLRDTWSASIEDYTYLDAVYYKGSLYFGRKKIIAQGAEPSVNDAWMLAVKGQGEIDESLEDKNMSSIFVVNYTDDANADDYFETPYKGFFTGENIANFPHTATPLCFEVSLTDDSQHVFQTAWSTETPHAKYFRTGEVTINQNGAKAPFNWSEWGTTLTKEDFNAFTKAVSYKHQLTEDTSFYVSASTGSDKNKGDSPTSAFKTIQYALDTITANYDLNEYTCTLHIGAGSYEENIVLPHYEATTGTMVLDGGSQDTTLILTESFATDFSAGTWEISHIHILFKDIEKRTTGNVYLVKTQGRSETFWDQCRFSCKEAPDTDTRDQIMFSAVNGGRAVFKTGLEFMPSATAKVLYVIYGENGIIEHQGGDSYTTVFGDLKPNNGLNTKGVCMKLSYFSTFKYTHPTGTEKPYFAGTLTNAYRYHIESSSICNVSGQGATALPGDTNGTGGTGGQYA